ncbi:MAG: hypothetical protein U7127_26545 [Phormidium sp.]
MYKDIFYSIKSSQIIFVNYPALKEGGAFGSPKSIGQANKLEPLGWFTLNPNNAITFEPFSSASPIQLQR